MEKVVITKKKIAIWSIALIILLIGIILIYKIYQNNKDINTLACSYSINSEEGIYDGTEIIEYDNSKKIVSLTGTLNTSFKEQSSDIDEAYNYLKDAYNEFSKVKGLKLEIFKHENNSIHEVYSRNLKEINKDSKTHTKNCKKYSDICDDENSQYSLKYGIKIDEYIKDLEERLQIVNINSINKNVLICK